MKLEKKMSRRWMFYNYFEFSQLLNLWSSKHDKRLAFCNVVNHNYDDHQCTSEKELNRQNGFKSTNHNSTCWTFWTRCTYFVSSGRPVSPPSHELHSWIQLARSRTSIKFSIRFLSDWPADRVSLRWLVKAFCTIFFEPLDIQMKDNCVNNID